MISCASFLSLTHGYVSKIVGQVIHYVYSRVHFSHREHMATVSNIVGQVIHYVYTGIPKTEKNAKEERKSINSQRRTKHINFAQSIKERNSLDYQQFSDLRSSHKLPYTTAFSIRLHGYQAFRS